MLAIRVTNGVTNVSDDIRGIGRKGCESKKKRRKECERIIGKRM